MRDSSVTIYPLEHHASFDWEAAQAARYANKEDGAGALAKLRRAAENRDARIVVSTAVSSSRAAQSRV